MFNKIINFSLRNKLIILIGVFGLIASGIYSMFKVPLDAVPDITNVQVQIVSQCPSLLPQEVEQLVTFPLEIEMINLPNVEEVRSISRFGLSIITIVFKEDTKLMLARQYVQERLNIAKSNLQAGLVEPQLMPITTGLGEIFQYVITIDKGFEHLYDLTNQRTIQDWIIKRFMGGIEGITEISSFGGFVKQYEVSVNPLLLQSLNLSLKDIIVALENNNQNSGGSYIENGPYSFYIRTLGRLENIENIKNIFIKSIGNRVIRVRDIAEINIGSMKRLGAMTMDGKGEVVGGITLMLKDANSMQTITNIEEKVEKLEKILPKGVHIYPYLNRSTLVEKTISTVKSNLIEGGLIVIFVLLLLLGNLRAGIIVASVIPLSMLFAFCLMNYFGISANLMSLGAIDFGIVIDGAVIIVESLLHTLHKEYINKKLSNSEMDGIVEKSTSSIYQSAAFGVLIILVVFIPILTLQGIEGKTFRPMAQTLSFAIIGSLILSITYVPVMTSLFISKKIKGEKNFSDIIMEKITNFYIPLLKKSMLKPTQTLLIGIIAFFISIFVFLNMGAEFVPTLEEGNLAMQQTIKSGSSLKESIKTSTLAESILKKNFPEVLHVISKIGTAEIPTDPMGIEIADIMIILKEKEEWVSAKSREELIGKMKDKLKSITWASYEFSQPIQMRFNELMTGAKTDISVKIFGEDLMELKSKADELAIKIKSVEGAADIIVDKTEGLRELSINYNRDKLNKYGINISDLNQVIRAAFAGETVGKIYENERRFDLSVRIKKEFREEVDLSKFSIMSNTGKMILLSELASIKINEGPMLISRERGKRYINIGLNVRNRDVESIVNDIKKIVVNNFELPAGYTVEYGGQFENLENAKKRLIIAVPIALCLILFLLYLAFNSIMDVLTIFLAVPFSIIGGVFGLFLRGMPFSISSGIGFIALFGVSVLNGIVLLSSINHIKNQKFSGLKELIQYACHNRLRPVLMTALVAALGFIPMAFSNDNGAEVQKPLATVVIGGLISSTILTLMILPSIYYLLNKKRYLRNIITSLIFIFGISNITLGQEQKEFNEILNYATQNHPLIKNSLMDIEIEKQNKKALGQLDPTNIIYQIGEINADVIDHNIQISQNITPFLGIKYKKNVADEKINLLIQNYALLLNEIKYNLLTGYSDLTYWSNKKSLYDTVYNLYLELMPKIKTKLTIGEIEQLEYELFNNEVLRIINSKTDFQKEFYISYNNFKNLAFLSDSIVPVINDLSPIPFEINEFDVDNSIYFKTYSIKNNLIEKQKKMVKIDNTRPHLSLGYFAQSLVYAFPFQGGIVGLSIPFDQRTKKAKIKELEMTKSKLENDKILQIRNFENELNSLRKNVELLNNSIKNYNHQKDNYSKLWKIIMNKYTFGQIDFLQLSQTINQILNGEIAYLDLIRSYNTQYIRLTYLTQKIN